MAPAFIKRQTITYFLSLLCGSALAACGGSSSSGPADAGPGPADGAVEQADAGTPDANLAVTARIVVGGTFDADSVDPALSYFAVTWQYEYATCAMLLNYADGEATELVPEIATALPDISADGLTYTFHIGSGFKLSPPSGEVVTAATVKATFDRVMDPALESPGGFFLQDVVSVEVTGDAQDEVTFTLSQQSGDFMARVAMPLFCVVPSDTPHEAQTTPVPTAGPYYMSSYTPITFDEASGAVTANGEIVISRNPNYEGTRPHVLDELHYVTGLDDAATLEQVKNNQADYLVAPGLATEDRAALLADYGAASANPRLFVHPALGYRFLALNTSRPTFANPDVRRAVQYAIDRAALGEALDWTPDDDYLPPGIPGRGSEHMYPLTGPDLVMANQLMGGAQATATLYIPDRAFAHTTADLVVANLGAIGIDVTVTAFAPNVYFDTLANPGEPFDIAFQGWFADYPDPFDFLNVLLASGFDQSHAQYADATFQADLEQAASLTGDARLAAYSALDVEAMTASPLVVMGNNNIYDFFSDRMGCVEYHPIYGMNVAKLCIK